MRQGARAPSACTPQLGGACTHLSANDERCFGGVDAPCEHYRAYVMHGGVTPTACTGV